MGLRLDELMVVLAEPSATQRKIIRQYLDNLGIRQLSETRTGGEALELMEDFAPDLVIGSLYLPDMTGTDLITAMRKQPDLDETAFMLISSETRLRYLEQIRQAGAIAILPKPFTQEDLRVALNTTLDFLDPQHLQLDDYDPESLHVLIVDDSLLSRNQIRRILSKMGLRQFSEACDGQEALEMVQSDFFDLIITDYNMPRMDGKELVDHIRSDSPQSSIPVLMVTSEENESRLSAVQQAGVSAICDKPFEPDLIFSLVQQIFSGE